MILKRVTSYILLIILSFYLGLGNFVVFALSPNDISNKVFFLDAQDTDNDGNSTNEPSNNSQITNLLDKFNSNTGSQVISSKQPLYETNSINSYPSLKFDGTDDLLDLKDNLQISVGTGYTEKSYAMIIKTGNDINTFQTIYDEGTKEKGFSFQIDGTHLYAGVYNTIDWPAGNQNKTIDLGVIQTNTIYTIIFVYDKNNDFVKAYLDGELKNTLNSISSQTTHGACTFETSFNCNLYSTGGTLAIGATKNDILKLSDSSTSVGLEKDFFKGYIGEISSYNHALTASEVSGLNDYLFAKWGQNIANGKIFHFDAQNTDGDFSDTNEPANNSSLGTWVDLKNNYNATQSTASDMGTYVTNTINGHPSINFDGTSQFYTIGNQPDINTGTSYQEKTFSMILKTNSDVNTFQVLYEQGGGTRGYSIQIENGHMYMGAWNNAEWDTGEQYKFIDLGVITTNTVYNILLIQDSTSGVDSTNILKAYIDGTLAGTLNHVDIQKKHSGDINIGQNVSSRKYDGTSPGNGHFFNGNIGEFISWNHALTDSEILDLNTYLIDRWDLDSTPPVINSTNISDNDILPGGNHNIVFNYSDTGTGATGIDTTTANPYLEKWNSSNSTWENITSTGLNTGTITTSSATYPTNNLDYGKYRFNFNIADNAGNISLNSQIIFYIDKPSMNISTGSVDIGTLNNYSNTFGNNIIVTVKTIGAPFKVKLKKNQSLDNNNSSDFIPYYDGIVGMGYDKNNDGNLSDYNDDIVGQENLNINSNGELNTYTYTVKMGAIIQEIQSAGNYEGKINFGIELDY